MKLGILSCDGVHVRLRPLTHSSHRGGSRRAFPLTSLLASLLASQTLVAGPRVDADGGASLTLAEAEAIAVADDPAMRAASARAAALEERSVAVGQRPDPRLKLGAAQVPIDSFDLDQEPMTQLQLGVQQHFPPGRSLTYEAQGLAESARAETLRVEARAAQVRLAVRRQFIEVRFQQRATAVLDATRAVFEELVDQATDDYASGRASQADVHRSRLERSRVHDRLLRAEQGELSARAALSEWIGAAATRPMNPNRDDPAWPREVALEAVDAHPMLAAATASVAAAERRVDAARERYKPGWTLDLTYGDRSGQNPDGSARADFLSAMVSIDLPVFQGRRQDRDLAARGHALAAAQAERDGQRRELVARRDRYRAVLGRDEDRIDLYREALLPAAQASADATLDDYRAGVGSMIEVLRARLVVLELELEQARVEADALQARAELAYLAGGAR